MAKRKLKDQGGQASEAPQEEVEKIKKGVEFIPFRGSENLEKCEFRIEKKTRKDGFITARKIMTKPGTPAYFINIASNGVLKLIKVEHRPNGIARRLYRVLKPGKSNERGANDRKLLKQLRALNIPGA